MVTSKNCDIYVTCPVYKKNGNKCPCDTENDEICERFLRIDALFKNALLSDKQREYVPLWMKPTEADYEAFVKLGEICKNIKQNVESGNSYYIYSKKCGNGKTTWSLKLLRCYLGTQWTNADFNKCHGLYINIPRYLLALKDNISNPSTYVQYIKDNINTAELVVFDEIGVKGLTEFEHEHMLNMINNRIDSGLSNIYTSNMSPEELKDKVGERLFSRIYNLSTSIEFVCGDYRGEVHNK